VFTTQAVADAELSTVSTPTLTREGFDLALVWPDGVRFALTAIRDGREGARGELTISRTASAVTGIVRAVSSRLVRRFGKNSRRRQPGVPWGDYLEEACWRLTQVARPRRTARDT